MHRNHSGQLEESEAQVGAIIWEISIQTGEGWKGSEACLIVMLHSTTSSHASTS